MHGRSGAALALHLGDVRDNAPNIGSAGLGPGVGEFTHWRGGRDRVDGDYFGDGMGYPGGGLIPVNHDALDSHVSSSA